MHGPTKLSILISFVIIIAISWIVYRLLKKCFSGYDTLFFRRFYWLTSATVAIGLTIIRTVQPGLISAEFFRIAFSWLMGQIIVLLLSPVFYSAYRLAAAGTGKTSAASDTMLSRRRFLRAAGSMVPLAALGISTYGVYSGGSHIAVQRHQLFLPQLPAYLDKLKIAQLSDTHIGLFFSVAKLEETLAAVRREQPDMLVITGDFLDDLSLLEPAMHQLSKLAGELKHGIYFSWGNHEYFRDINKIRQAFKATPVTVLANGSHLIIDAKQPFYILGVDYPWAERGLDQIAKRKAMFEQAIKDVPENAFKILLSHHPDFIDNAFSAGIPLTLTGHTHGGQIALFGQSLLPVTYQYMRGLYQHHNSYGYVSTGAGSWFPFRLGCPAEFAVFTLHCG
ncbi:metallophosphoesterase|uniref:Calcineurin-like phosphoesterase domain-containing protein n=1 Tax=Dendrosporobacter quercicolus TaxID=146817 RepID=A0A1G9UNP3_9FIRM|nr:metallophosphoesterase [Dendrosporobacter quercicolus]NSL48075.1 metallophosphoesterase [Dendrosporobacter quercicolus DSM 1736]SDM61572.1 hypothetical protein SAMN04488502_10610 [Dendrosporobacter quercicolus]